MICPYCGKEMDQGYIKSAKQLFWSNKKESEFIKLSPGFRNAFYGAFYGFSVDSYYCPDCKKIIMPVE